MFRAGCWATRCCWIPSTAVLGPGLAIEMLSPGRNIHDIISLKIPVLHFCRKITFPMGVTGCEAVCGKYSQGIKAGNVLRAALLFLVSV